MTRSTVSGSPGHLLSPASVPVSPHAPPIHVFLCPTYADLRTSLCSSVRFSAFSSRRFCSLSVHVREAPSRSHRLERERPRTPGDGHGEHVQRRGARGSTTRANRNNGATSTASASLPCSSLYLILPSAKKTCLTFLCCYSDTNKVFCWRHGARRPL